MSRSNASTFVFDFFCKNILLSKHGSRFRPVRHAKFGVHGRLLIAHRLFASAQALADLRVGLADNQLLHHANFGGCESMRRWGGK